MRLIDADELKGRTTNFDEEGCRIWHEWDIDNAPTVERPKGKWVCLVPPEFLEVHYEEYHPIPFGCSCCKEALYFVRDSEKEATICPFCGADMRGEADNGDDI